MKRLLILAFILPLLSQAQDFTIYITDNRGKQYISYNYLITTDSLIIAGLSDNGKTNVNYLSRKLSKGESKSLNSFLKDFTMEKLNETYFGEYANFSYINSDNYPRVIEARLVSGERKKMTKLTNAYVNALKPLFDKIETLLPDEVKFGLKPEDFGKTF